MSIRELAKLRTIVDTVNVGNPSSGSLSSANIGKFPWDATSVGKRTPQSPGSLNTTKAIQERNLAYMLKVARPFSLNLVSFYIRKLILERNPMYVMSVARASPRRVLWVHISKLTLERNRTNAKSVIKPLGRRHASCNIRGFTQERLLCLY